MSKQEELFGRKQSWKGLNFRGFEDTNAVTTIIKKKQQILARNRKTMKELCGVDVQEVASHLNTFLSSVGVTKNKSVETVSATAITEDIEFNPYCSTIYDDEIVEVLTGIEPTLVDEFEGDIIETNVGTRYAHPFIQCFNDLNSFKLQAEPMVSTFTLTDKSRYNQLTTELSKLICDYMDKTKTVNDSTNSTNVHAPNEPSNESGNLNTENRQPSTSGVTYFKNR